MGYPVYDHFYQTYTSAAVIAQYLRVKLTSAGALDIAGAAEPAIGVIDKAAVIGQTDCRVRSARAPEFNAVASVAIAVGGAVFAADAGKVAATGTIRLGIAKKASTADGQVILVVPTDATA